MSSQTTSTDVAIIGAGPVGLFSIFESGLLGLSCQVIDSLPEIGGQCNALYPEKPIYDIPAHPHINAGDLIEKLYEQAAAFKPFYHLNQQVTDLKKADGLWHLNTSKNTIITAKAIIIAAGSGAFGPNRPPLKDLELYEEKSVSYMIRNCQDFANKHLVIAGGGDSAVDWAVSLSQIAQHIYFVHRRDKFRATTSSIKKLHALADLGKIEIITPYQLDGLNGTDGQICSVTIKSLDGDIRDLKADHLLPFFGLAANLGPLKEWGLDIEKNQIKTNQATSMTSVSGIFAVGDIAHYDHKLKLILTGFAEAAQAAHAIQKLIYPDQEHHFEYSTTHGIPKI
jgi:thioredoxin reductase (NADPH)